MRTMKHWRWEEWSCFTFENERYHFRWTTLIYQSQNFV